LRALKNLIIVVGLSGAGKSTALNTIADSGYYCVDNIPASLISPLLESDFSDDRVAILPRVSGQEECQALLTWLNSDAGRQLRPNILFLDTRTSVLVRRYSETRRPHPLFNPDIDSTIQDTIERERRLLAPLREIATYAIDSSELHGADLKRAVGAWLGENLGLDRKFRLNFQSFGFKYGLPIDCDLVVDVRFLPNPHYDPQLKPLSGIDKPVADFLAAIPDCRDFIGKYGDLIKFLLPKYKFEGKAGLNVGIGCTGGKHRSVYISEQLTKISLDSEIVVSVRHRDLGKE
jgi:UPF0042 nucleotide-binding protein